MQKHKHTISTTYVNLISRVKQDIVASKAYDTVKNSTILTLKNSFYRFVQRVPSGLRAYQAKG